GFLLADYLRKDPETRSTPIVFVASRRFRGANHKSVAVRRYAPATYLRAPAELSELRGELEAIFAPATAAPAADAGAAPRPTPSRTTAVVPDPEQRREKRVVERTA